MIISKSNLQVVQITKHDKIPMLNNVVVEPDGSTVGSNGKALMLVSPVSEKVRNSFPLKDLQPPERIIFPEETAKEVIKNMPKDTKFGGVLEHCKLEVDLQHNDRVNFETTDGKRSRHIVAKRWDRQYIDYRKILQRVGASKNGIKVAVNLRRLITLLESIDKACPDSTANSAVFFEFTDENDIVIRAQNHSNGQRAVGLMQSYKGIEGKWLEHNKWERSLYGDINCNNNLDVDSNGDTAGSNVVGTGVLARKIPPKKKQVGGAKVPKRGYGT